MSSFRRLEDLGKISILLDAVLENSLFDNIQHGAKRWPEWFWARTIEEQHDIIHSIGCGISDVQEELLRCLEIAEGSHHVEEVHIDMNEEIKKFMQGFAYKAPKREEGEYEP